MRTPHAAFCAALLTMSFAGTSFAACDPKKPIDPPTARFEIQGATAYDTKTRLTWQRCSVGQTFEYGAGCTGEVSSYTLAESQTFKDGGKDEGWRLPTRKELSGLVAGTCKEPAINAEVFPGMDLDTTGYWTSTADGPTRQWYINFADGSERTYGGSLFRNALRLVRTGK